MDSVFAADAPKLLEGIQAMSGGKNLIKVQVTSRVLPVFSDDTASRLRCLIHSVCAPNNQILHQIKGFL